MSILFAEAIHHLHTVRDLLRFAVSRFTEAKLFFGHGFTNAYDEAAYLILHTLHLPLDRLDLFLDARLLPEERRQLLDVLEKRVQQRVPAAYLTREAWLGGHCFYVDERVIVPRSFIAELLPEGLAPWIPDEQDVLTALDLCTGSGCLAVLLANAYSNASVDAADISSDALDVARRNVIDHGLEDEIRLVQSNLYSALAGCKYDLIVSNPPYVTAASMAELPEEYWKEPDLALASGADGLDHIRVIVREAPQHLEANGVLVVEVGHNRDAVCDAFPNLPFTWLDTASGDGFVFLLERSALAEAGV
ncbi:MAG: 50S ribosomal protein L3 N(5)-glutamine methyltransferase [Burkholderiales bacterium]